MQFPFETYQGILIGIVFAFGAFLITRLPKYQWFAASALCVLITPLALLPFWFSYGDLGISDWDYYFSMHTNLRDSIVTHNQFPLWNPYTCGGTSALGDPEFPVFSPLFIFELLFGTPAGLRLSIFASTAIGALGMLHLSRKIGVGVLGALVASLAMSFGSVNLLEIVEGHQNILAAMYIPWVFYAWYGAYRFPLSPIGERAGLNRYTIITAILLALMFFQGGIYLLMYMAGAFIGLILFVRHSKRAICITAIASMLALGLSSVKLIPVALWIGQFQDNAYASSAFTLANLHDIFLGRILYGAENIIPNQGSGWHEYGAYIGPFILFLACIGYISHRKNRIVNALVISTILAILISSSGPILKPLFDQLSFIPRSNISRVVLFAVIPLSLLAGFGLDSIQKKSRIMRQVAFIFLAVASIDIMSFAYPLASQAFVLPHVTRTIMPASYPIAYNPFSYKIRHEDVDYTRSYDATLAGYGNMSYCSVLGPSPAVKIITDEGNTSILEFSDDTQATFILKRWSPNRVIAQVHTTQKTHVTLNANYAKGWFVNNISAKEKGNRPSYMLEPGDTTIEFAYVPPGMWAGVGVSLLTIVAMVISVPLSRSGRGLARRQG